MNPPWARRPEVWHSVSSYGVQTLAACLAIDCRPSGLQLSGSRITGGISFRDAAPVFDYAYGMRDKSGRLTSRNLVPGAELGESSPARRGPPLLTQGLSRQPVLMRQPVLIREKRIPSLVKTSPTRL